MTTFENKCLILSDLWLNYRNDVEFEDFIEYNDMGLPLAYALSEGIVNGTESSDKFIDETFDLFIFGLGIVDTGFDSLDEMMSLSEQE
jgi:phosphoenolpyruvate synthase/pyruvate phosphate dikinase